MKISQTAQKIKLNQVMDISVDVHKDSLNFFFEGGGKEYSDECGNRTTVIAKRFEGYHQIAAEHGTKTLRIICEPTGQYHNKLFRMARECTVAAILLETLVDDHDPLQFRQVVCRS